MAKTKTKDTAPAAALARPSPRRQRAAGALPAACAAEAGAAVRVGIPKQIPRLVKVVLNVGEGEAAKNAKLLDAIVVELAQITGQRPVVTRAKKSIANFGLREGMAIGAAVTLRGARMWEFLDRFVNIAIPRVRDFRGLPSRSFDGRGSYSIGIKEQIIFPEIDYDKVEKIHGMNITFVTNAGRDDLAMALLLELGMPFRGETPVAVG
jgi:large subunit ribosomal protein L5